MKYRLAIFMGLSAAAMLSIPCPTNAADTMQNFEATFFPEPEAERFRIDQRGSDPTGEVLADGWDSNFLRLTQAVNDQNNGLGFNQAYTGAYDALQIDFDFRIFPGGADGVGLALLDTGSYGDSTATITPSFSEEVNLTNSLGVGFDTYGNGGAADELESSDSAVNAISLHWNGAIVENVKLADLDIPALETDAPGTVMSATVRVDYGGGDGSEVTVFVSDGQNAIIPFDSTYVEGLTPYDGRVAFGGRTGGQNANQDLDNIRLTLTRNGVQDEILFEDFEEPVGVPAEAPPEVIGGTPYAIAQYGGNPSPQIARDAGAPMTPEIDDGFMRVAHEAGGQIGVVAFDVTSDITESIIATFKLRGLSNDNTRADGASFLLVDTETYGDTGTIENFNPVEDPNLADALGIGFDTYNPNDGGVDDSEPFPITSTEPNVGNHVSLHWDGQRVGAVRFDRGDIDLVNGEFNDMTVEVTEADGGSVVSVTMVDGTDGSQHSVFDNLFVPGLQFDVAARAAIAARTGGQMDNYDFDDILVRFLSGGTLTCDLNGDGACDTDDIDLMMNEIATGGNAPALDLTGDGLVNDADRDAWLADAATTNGLAGPYLTGDSDLSGAVNAADLNALAVNWQSDANDWTTGNFTGAGVNAADLNEIGINWQQSVPVPAPVPEPGTLMLLLFAAAPLLLSRGRRS